MGMTPKEALNEALVQLQERVVDVVRDEQLRDQLTGLPNGQSLKEHAETALAKMHEKRFWIAFLEVDKMKSLNDRYGHNRADVLLIEIARTMSHGISFFGKCGHECKAFRASGDEFYLVGWTGSEPIDVMEVEARLNQIRSSIALLQVSTDIGETMQCTVSIGWVGSDKMSGATYSAMMDKLECAVSNAKRTGRNRTVQYDEALEISRAISVRTECRACGSAFSVDAPRAILAERRDLSCPTCGVKVAMPALPTVGSAERAVSI